MTRLVAAFSASAVVAIAVAATFQFRSVADRLGTIERSLERLTRQAGSSDLTPEEFAAAPSLGNRESASLVVVEYTDFECPFCQRFVRRTWPEFKRLYVDTGKVLFVFKHLPLSFHGQALPAARAAECGREQGKFWPLHDALFRNNGELSSEAIDRAVQVAGIEREDFKRCMALGNDSRIFERIVEDRTRAKELQIAGTPTFLIGEPLGDGRMRIDEAISGDKPLEEFKLVIDTLLAARDKASK